MLRERLAMSLRVPHFPAGRDPLLGVHDVPWGRLMTGFGAPAAEVPDVLVALRAGGSGSVLVHGMDFGATEALWAVVTHQGTMGTATAPTARFLARLVAEGGLEHALRAELLAWLSIVGNESRQLDPWSRDGSADPDQVAIARSVCDVLVAETPLLFVDREREPEGIQFCLALLAAAAFDADQFDGLLHDVADLAARYAGTPHGAALSLGRAVMIRDDERADALAEDVAAFIDVITDDLFEDDDVPSGYRARFLLGAAIVQLVPS